MSLNNILEGSYNVQRGQLQNIVVNNGNINNIECQNLRLKELSGENKINIKSPDILSDDYTLTLPTSDGTNGQAIITNGSGQLSFSTITPAVTTTFADNTFRIFDSADNTKNLAFDVGTIATGTTRTLTMKNADSVIPTLDNTKAGYVESINQNLSTSSNVTFGECKLNSTLDMSENKIENCERLELVYTGNPHAVNIEINPDQKNSYVIYPPDDNGTAGQFLRDNPTGTQHFLYWDSTFIEGNYVPIFTATVSNPVTGVVALNTAYYYIIDNNIMFIQWKFEQTSGGLAGVGNYQISLPPGYQIDGEKYDMTSYNNIGNCSFHVPSVSQSTGVVRATDVFSGGNTVFYLMRYDAGAYFSNGFYPLTGNLEVQASMMFYVTTI